MKYCISCDKEFETEETKCSICGDELKCLVDADADVDADGYEAVRTVSVMMATGII